MFILLNIIFVFVIIIPNMDNDTIHRLKEISERRISSASTSFVRPLYDEVEWNARMILIKGCRGVGKTYMILQHLKISRLKNMYISLDNLFFLTHSLTDTIDFLYREGFRLIGIDEIHKYPDWSIELKNIYDDYHDLRIVMTSSSALNVLSGKGDLSRRLDEYHMKGLSFNEFLKYEHGYLAPTFTWEELLTSHESLSDEYYAKWDITRKFNVYLKRGYYPYFKEAGNRFDERIIAVIKQVIEADMAAIFKIDYESTRQIKKLLAIIARIVPFSPNITKLSRDMALSRHSVLHYLDYLNEADILNLLKSEAKSDSALTKPDKVFFENTNFIFAFGNDVKNTGTVRETFVLNALSRAGNVSTPVKGDFLMDKKYTIEVGGVHKNFHQLSGMPNPILIKEGIGKGSRDVLPMWTLGFLKDKVGSGKV